MIDYFEYAKRIKEDGIEGALGPITSQIRESVPRKLYMYVRPMDSGNNVLEDQAQHNVADDKKLETLEDGEIYLSNPEQFNDPFDCKGFFYDKNRMRNIRLGSEGRDFRSLVRVACFTDLGPNAMPMWAHYAANHQGCCIEYDLSDECNADVKKRLYPVQYSGQRLDITEMFDEAIGRSKSAINRGCQAEIGEQYLSLILAMLINIKHDSWSYEHEYRCVVPAYETDGSSIGEAPSGIRVRAVPSAVYIGWKCHKNYVKRLVHIGKIYEIPVFRMRFDELSFDYELVPVLVEELPDN